MTRSHAILLSFMGIKQKNSTILSMKFMQFIITHLLESKISHSCGFPLHLELPRLSRVISKEYIHHLQIFMSKVRIDLQIIKPTKDSTKTAIHLAHSKVLAYAVTASFAEWHKASLLSSNLFNRFQPPGGIENLRVREMISLSVPR